MAVPAKSPEHIALGAAIRELRESGGISQEELGYRIQPPLHRNMVGRAERGELDITFSTLTRLAAALGVPLSELAGRYEERLSRGSA